MRLVINQIIDQIHNKCIFSNNRYPYGLYSGTDNMAPRLILLSVITRLTVFLKIPIIFIFSNIIHHYLSTFGHVLENFIRNLFI